MTQEENTKSATDNSNSNLIESHNREIKRLEELEWTLVDGFLDQPNKKFLALDLWKFLEDFPQVKVDIELYIRHCLEQLSTNLYDREVIQRYRKRVIELEQQLKEKENDTELH